MSNKIDGRYVAEVLAELEDRPEMIENDALIAYHTQIGYWTAIAEGNAEKSHDDRKYAEADAMLAARLQDPKATSSVLEAHAIKAAKPLKDAESRARMQAEKLRNLYDSLSRAIDLRKLNEGK